MLFIKVYYRHTQYLHPVLFCSRQRLSAGIKNIKESKGINNRKQIFSLLFAILIGLLILPMEKASVSVYNEKQYLLSPISNGKIIQEFGNNWNENKKSYHKHNGIDISASNQPTNVTAAADGKVISKGWHNIALQLREITLLHDKGLITRYLSLDEVHINQGQMVKQGQEIGHTPRFIHFEVYKNGQFINPEKLLKKKKWNQIF